MGTIRTPEKQPHLRGALAFLAKCGADQIEVFQNKRVAIVWKHGAQRMAVALSISGRGEHHETRACQAIRRRYRQAGIEVGRA